MKLFHNFNTKHRSNIYKESCVKFGKENVLVLRRAYVFFVFHILLPVFFMTIAIFLSIGGVSYLFTQYYGYTEYLGYINVVILLFWLAGIGIPILKKYIDYKMDFLLITPNYISVYNQTGIFSRSNRVIDTTNIESITIPKTTFFMSIFNYATIVFLSGISEGGAGDDDGKGQIKFYYVYSPEKTKKAITSILQKNSTNGYFSKENNPDGKNEFIQYTQKI